MHPLYRWLARPRRSCRAYRAGNAEAHGEHCEATGQSIPLADLQAEERGVVQGLSGGRFVIQRLAALGLTPGADVEMTQNYGWGPLIVSARGARVALGRGEARHVTVERKQS